MVQFASYLRHVLCKTRLIFPRINGPNNVHIIDSVVFSTCLKHLIHSRKMIRWLKKELSRTHSGDARYRFAITSS